MTSKPTLLVLGKVHPRARERFETLFDVIFRSADSPVPRQPEEIDAVATFLCPVDATVIDALPKLKIVSSFGVGYDHVDAAHAAGKNIMVTHTPDVLDDEVADTAVGLLLATVRELPKAEKWLRDGRWISDGSYRLTPLTLRERKVGIFGLGRIGQAIAHRLSAFGLPIHYHNRRQKTGVDYPYYASLLDLAHSVDTLISVVPASASTEKAVNAKVLSALGTTGVFINVGRGNVVDEQALADALHTGTIAAAGLDVFADEPNVPDGLMTAPNTVLLPHVASASIHTRQAMADLVVNNLISWFDGKGAITPTPECK